MIKKIVFSFSLLCSLTATAQENSGSPYSFYGLGDQKFKGSNEQRAMGGLGVIGDSIHLNLSNPASYANLGLTTFSVGASYTSYDLQSQSSKEKLERASLDYVAVGFPVGKKAGVSFGLMPFTSVGYKIQSTSSFLNTPQSMQYTGSGGLNKVYVGGSYKITKEFSLGLDAQYYFGKIENKALVAVQNVQYLSRSINEANNSGLAFNIGAMYQTKIKGLDFHSSATFSPKADLTTSHDRKIATIVLMSTGAENVVEEQNVNVADSKFKLPATYSFGTSIGKLNKWMIGAEYTFADAKDFVGGSVISNLQFDNSSKLSVGGYYIPKYNSFSSYFDRVTYRAGFRHENTGMIINGEKINDMAVTAGVGLPLNMMFSNVNIGLEYGKRGTKNAGLIQENYFMINFGFSFNDRWFQKVKYY